MLINGDIVGYRISMDIIGSQAFLNHGDFFLELKPLQMSRDGLRYDSLHVVHSQVITLSETH